MNPDAVPIVIAFIGSMSVAGLAKGAEMLGPLGLRRIRLVAELVSLLVFLGFLVWAFWNQSWWQGVGFAGLLIVCTIAQWRHNRFEEIRQDWAGCGQ